MPISVDTASFEFLEGFIGEGSHNGIVVEMLNFLKAFHGFVDEESPCVEVFEDDLIGKSKIFPSYTFQKFRTLSFCF